MDSDSDCDDYVVYGTALEPLEQENASRRKPLPVDQQTVKDAQGRRRFHGAFTGGWSAGHFNTVATPEGFTPAAFVSSRQNRRAATAKMAPRDFMDEEDLGEFGIAPQRVAAKPEFQSATVEGATIQQQVQFRDSVIPGDTHYFDQLMKPVRDTAGVTILKNLGWRPGQGIGPRLTRAEKKRQLKRKVYGCVRSWDTTPSCISHSAGEDDESDGDENDDDDGDENDDHSDAEWCRCLLAPDDEDAPVVRPKLDRFGLGYSGLRDSSAASASESTRAAGVFRHSDPKGKLAIRGQAFGVGAFEDEDDMDIYSAEDMTQYDFQQQPAISSQTPSSSTSTTAAHSSHHSVSHTPLCRPVAGFVFGDSGAISRPPLSRYQPPALPAGYRADWRLHAPLHAAGGSRFSAASNDADVRKRLTAEQRSQLIGEEPVQPATQTVQTQESAEPTDDSAICVEAATKSTIRPFASDEPKQRRYELFLKQNNDDERKAVLVESQPATMSAWERERECSEFQRAAAMFRPLCASLAGRFVSAGVEVSQPQTGDTTPSGGRREKLEPCDPAVEAARCGMFGRLTRVESAWQPDLLLCRRFNVRPPHQQQQQNNNSTGDGGTSTDRGGRLALFDCVSSIGQPAAISSDPISPTCKTESCSETPVPATNTEHADVVAEVLDDDSSSVQQPLPAATPDLFKAIFDDTESDDENEKDHAGGRDKPGETTESNVATTQATTSTEVTHKDRDINTASSDSARDQRTATPPPAQSPDVAAVDGKKTAPKDGASTGLFANIDFDRLNSWRQRESNSAYTTSSSYKSAAIVSSSETSQNTPSERKTSAAAADSTKSTGVVVDAAGDDVEYGPALPPTAKPPDSSRLSSRVSVAPARHQPSSHRHSSGEWNERSCLRDHCAKNDAKEEKDERSRHKKTKRKRKSKKHSHKKRRRHEVSSEASDSSSSTSEDAQVLRKLQRVMKRSKKRAKHR